MVGQVNCECLNQRARAKGHKDGIGALGGPAVDTDYRAGNECRHGRERQGSCSEGTRKINFFKRHKPIDLDCLSNLPKNSIKYLCC